MLLRLLKDPDKLTRLHAAQTLRHLKLRLPEVIPALAEALNDSGPHVREMAAIGLREMAGEVEKLRPGLIASLGDLGQERYEVRRQMIAESERYEIRRLARLKAKPKPRQ